MKTDLVVDLYLYSYIKKPCDFTRLTQEIRIIRG
jgi:hypothetical protein